MALPSEKVFFEFTAAETAFVQNIAALAYEQGDILYYNGTAITVLHHGTAGQVLQTGGHAANPSWSSDYVLKAGDTMLGTLIPADHVTPATAEVGGICYGTGTPPTANTTPIGTIYVTHTP
jgi:hypothetical protein